MGNPASPPALSAGEFAEAHRREEGPVVLVADPAGIRPLEPGVIEQPVDVAQLEPVGRPPEQPRPDALAPVPLGDTQVADVGPSCGPGEPLSLVERLHLDVPDHVRPEHGGPVEQPADLAGVPAILAGPLVREVPRPRRGR